MVNGQGVSDAGRNWKWMSSRRAATTVPRERKRERERERGLKKYHHSDGALGLQGLAVPAHAGLQGER
jgi:hypothetical protein